MKNLILAGSGGFLGAALRYLMIHSIRPANLFWTTLLINIIGSFLIGLIISQCIRDISFSNNWRVFLATGICGGFTTFSAFSLENMQLLQDGKYLLAFSYIVSSVVFGIAACFIGYKITA